MADKRTRVRSMFHEAVDKGQEAKAAGIAAAASVYDPDLDLRKRKSKTDSSVTDLSAAEEMEYQRFLDAAGVNG